jgi:RHS repeat-associated protein
VGSRSVTLNYDAKNLLASLTQNGASVPYTYDALGNIRSKGNQSFTFDLGNRLKASSLGGNYVYDGLGRRVQLQSTDGSIRLYAYSQAGQVLWSTSSGGPRPASTTAYIYLGGKQIAEANSATGVQYVHTDALGSPVARTSATGAVLNRTRFEAYGYPAAGTKPSPATSQIGFTGHVQDAESELVYMQQRYYDPIAGRFLSVDPVVTDANSGKSFGRYHYADNSPYAKVDPDGMKCKTAQGKSECTADFVEAGVKPEDKKKIEAGMTTVYEHARKNSDSVYRMKVGKQEIKFTGAQLVDVLEGAYLTLLEKDDSKWDSPAAQYDSMRGRGIVFYPNSGAFQESIRRFGSSRGVMQPGLHETIHGLRNFSHGRYSFGNEYDKGHEPVFRAAMIQIMGASLYAPRSPSDPKTSGGK